jgi:hypothetical protein
LGFFGRNEQGGSSWIYKFDPETDIETKISSNFNSEVIGVNLEAQKAGSSLTTPELCPKEQRSLFGDPEGVRGRVHSE